mmetsp:Transcript_73807/g.227968  ORF Transcript_73807/g.227968 Transcript_73807/m.227968 type:complete len:213 (+) Transcript_73807:722-1360(+)
MHLPGRPHALGQRHGEASHVRPDVEDHVPALAECLQSVGLAEVEGAKLPDGVADVDVHGRRDEEVRQLPQVHVPAATQPVGEVAVPARLQALRPVLLVAAGLGVQAVACGARLVQPAPLSPAGRHRRAGVVGRDERGVVDPTDVHGLPLRPPLCPEQVEATGEGTHVLGGHPAIREAVPRKVRVPQAPHASVALPLLRVAGRALRLRRPSAC